MITFIPTETSLYKAKKFSRYSERVAYSTAERRIEQLPETRKYKVGDIIKWSNGFYQTGTWMDWFIKEEERTEENFMEKKYIPKYARNAFGIILCRYRVTKVKYFAKFRDYGTYIMFLSKTPGKKKKIYAFSPFDVVCRFPYVDMPECMHNTLEKLNLIDLPHILISKYGNTLNARMKFITEFYNRMEGAHV